MHRLLLAAAIALMVPATGHAVNPQFTKTQLCQVLTPCEAPARFASGPYLAPPVIKEVSLQQVQAACGGGVSGRRAAASGHGIMGCARIERSACVVHVPRDVKTAVPELFEVILAHELAHCRGWVH